MLKGGVGGRSPPVGERMLVLVVGMREIKSLAPVCRRERDCHGWRREVVQHHLFKTVFGLVGLSSMRCSCGRPDSPSLDPDTDAFGLMCPSLISLMSHC